MGKSSLNEEDNNINIGEDNNINIGKDNNKVVNEDNCTIRPTCHS